MIDNITIIEGNKDQSVNNINIRKLYNDNKDNLWLKSPFYPNNLKSFEKWFNKYLRMIERLDNMSDKEYNALKDFFDLRLKDQKLDNKIKLVYMQLQKLFNNTPNKKLNLIGFNEILKNNLLKEGVKIE